MYDARNDFRYTALFCEENIWWLARDMVARGVPPGNLQVLLFSNPTQSILMLNQRAAPVGQAIAWDYHVVLKALMNDAQWVFDFDTRLAFPEGFADYLRQSFPEQSLLPVDYRAVARLVPASAYLSRFSSDRSHMRGRVPASAFPDYPIIQAEGGASPITLADYRDMQKELGDGSRLLPLQVLRDAADAGDLSGTS
jgi:hypothetical protein